MIHLNFVLLVMIGQSKDKVDLTWSQCQFLRVTDDFPDMINMHATAFINFKSAVVVREEVVPELLDVDVHDSAAGQVEAHVVEVGAEVVVLDLVITILHHVIAKQKVNLLDGEIACIRENFAHLVEIDLSSVLLAFGVSVVCFKSALQDGRNLLDLCFEDKHERLLVDVLDGCWLFLQVLIASQERLDSVNTDRDELSPSDVADFVFISERQKHSNVVLTKVICRQAFECIKELNVGKLSVLSCICLFKQSSKGTFKRFYKPR